MLIKKKAVDSQMKQPITPTMARLFQQQAVQGLKDIVQVVDQAWPTSPVPLTNSVSSTPTKPDTIASRQPTHTPDLIDLSQGIPGEPAVHLKPDFSWDYPTNGEKSVGLTLWTIGKPLAEKVLQCMKDSPGLLETMAQSSGCGRTAIEAALADTEDVEEEDWLLALKLLRWGITGEGSHWQQQPDPCSLYPGWGVTELLYPPHSGSEPIVMCGQSSGRTFAGGTILSQRDLETWWAGLSPLERALEHALQDQHPTYGQAEFHNVNSVDEVLDWITDNRRTIHTAARQFGIDPALLAGILSSEALFDYQAVADPLGDWLISSRLLNVLSWGMPSDLADKEMTDIVLGVSEGGITATGFANVHAPTLVQAYEHLYNVYGEHNPWIAGGGTALGDWTSLQQVSDVAQYMLEDTGNIRAAAMVTRMLVDQYIEGTDRDPRTISPEDMGIIFGAYRGGRISYVPDIDAFEELSEVEKEEALRDYYQSAYDRLGLGPNAIISGPVMAHMIQLFPRD